jgi:hypothetical protein
MKKVIFILTAVFAVMLASCSNDDIPMTQSITFKVNPSTVVSDLYEYSAGELTTITSDYQLSVTLYIYDDAGNLIEKRNQKFSDYTHIMNESLNIGYGKYTIVATTMIIGKNKDFNYWIVSGEENLSTFTIQDEGYIGGREKILGLSTSKVTLNSSTRDISIDVNLAGAVALVEWDNWNRYSDVVSWDLVANRTCDNLVLDNDANVHYSVESATDYSWYVASMEHDSSYGSGYMYAFLFPMQNVKMSFAAESTSGNLYYLGTGLNADIELGKSYYFVYDVTENETHWYDTTGSRGIVDQARSIFNFEGKLASDTGLVAKRFGFQK